jgi:hypothetical protein
MMMPGMIQQAMAAGAAAVQPGVPPPPMAAAPPQAPPQAPLAAAAVAAAAPPGPKFQDLAPVSADPKALVRSVVTAAGYALEESGDTWQVVVPVGALRKQKVRVEFGQPDESGHAMVHFWSVCGPATESNAALLLRYNAETVHGAFATRQIEGREMVVLQAKQLATTLTPLEVSRVLSAIAWQADEVEQKLVGSDEY